MSLDEALRVLTAKQDSQGRRGELGGSPITALRRVYGLMRLEMVFQETDRGQPTYLASALATSVSRPFEGCTEK